MILNMIVLNKYCPSVKTPVIAAKQKEIAILKTKTA